MLEFPIAAREYDATKTRSPAGLHWKVCATACSALLAATAASAANRPRPNEQLQQILSRLGDRSLVRGGHVDSDGRWAWLTLQPRTPQEGARGLRLTWEQTLVAGALRDAMGTRLWGWSGSDGHHPTDFGYPYRQRFPSPSERAFRKRLTVASHRWHFDVVERRYLRPLQGAPMVVVRTREPARLARAAGAIRDFLAGRRYEGFYFEVKGAFAFATAYRGTWIGTQWARSKGLSPFPPR